MEIMFISSFIGKNVVGVQKNRLTKMVLIEYPQHVLTRNNIKMFDFTLLPGGLHCQSKQQTRLFHSSGILLTDGFFYPV